MSRNHFEDSLDMFEQGFGRTKSPLVNKTATVQEQRGNTLSEIHEGERVTHTDKHGTSLGVADSDGMPSSNRIKISFDSGIRKGECRWVPLNEVRRHEMRFLRIGLI